MYFLHSSYRRRGEAESGFCFDLLLFAEPRHFPIALYANANANPHAGLFSALRCRKVLLFRLTARSETLNVSLPFPQKALVVILPD